MQFTNALFSFAAMIAIASAMATPEPLEKRIADPGNPANLVNCEPGGGADDCHLEQPVSSEVLSFTLQGSHPPNSAAAFVSTTVLPKVATTSGEDSHSSQLETI